MIVSIFGNIRDTANGKYAVEKTINKLRQILDKNIEDESTHIYIARFGDFAFNVAECCMEFKETHFNTNVYLVSDCNCKRLAMEEPYSLRCDGKIYLDICGRGIYDSYAKDKWMIEQANVIITCYQYEDKEANAVFEYLIKHKRQFINLGQYQLKKVVIKY